MARFEPFKYVIVSRKTILVKSNCFLYQDESLSWRYSWKRILYLHYFGFWKQSYKISAQPPLHVLCCFNKNFVLSNFILMKISERKSLQASNLYFCEQYIKINKLVLWIGLNEKKFAARWLQNVSLFCYVFSIYRMRIINGNIT